MNDYKEKSIFYNQVFSELRYFPAKHLVLKKLTEYDCPKDFDGYVFDLNRDAEQTSFLNIDDITINKLKLTSDLRFYKDRDPVYNSLLQAFQLEVYLVIRQSDYSSRDLVLLSLEEVILYVNEHNNTKAKEQYEFPELRACNFVEGSFNYISASREIKNSFFIEKPGLSAALHIDFEHELREIYTIAANNLAFLYRSKDRVFGEITSLKNEKYQLGFHLYPRFNNAVSEVASSLYSLWERIGFIMNAFFEAEPGSTMTPSFKGYIVKKRKEANQNSALNTTSFQWFIDRLANQHERLSELRHPMIHYNDKRDPPGMRSVELLKVRRRELNVSELIAKWSGELDFLKSELHQVSEGLEKTVSLVKEWAEYFKLKQELEEAKNQVDNMQSSAN